jgi:hypothetical protein
MHKVRNTGLGHARTQYSNIPVIGMSLSQKLKVTDMYKLNYHLQQMENTHAKQPPPPPNKNTSMNY